MALYMKQDFCPPILSRRWIAMKFRPNMTLYSRQHMLSILESGLLFREDSVEVEQEAPGGRPGGWLTRGERAACACALLACVAAFPPRSLNRSTLINLAAYLAVPAAVRACHRLACRGSLCALLASMRDYLALARRAAACLRECSALRADLGSVSSAIESTHTMLCRQQSELAIMMSRASSAVLGNVPWLRGDVAWDSITRDNTDNLLKIHHAFLVVQSTLLKHIALAHHMPPAHAHRIYKNHNERIYWIHSVVLPHLTVDFQQSFEALERMYRLLKNYGNSDVVVANKKMGAAVRDSWVYSDVHSGVARAGLELKLALNKCNNLDMFLDSCALNKQEIDLDILNKDIDDLIENITKTLITAQNSQMRLRKLQNRFCVASKETRHEEMIEDGREILGIEDREPEARDEVFYFIRTDDDDNVVQPAADITTGPGRKEKEATEIVLTELKRKLVKREDVMRERERQALAKTMPELKDNVPEFPRQMTEDSNRKGFISKIREMIPKKRRFKRYMIKPRKSRNRYGKYKLKTGKYTDESDIRGIVYEVNLKNVKGVPLTFSMEIKKLVIIRWYKETVRTQEKDSSGMSECLSDEVATINRTVNQAASANNEANDGEARNLKFSKKDLELSPSSSESDFEFYEKQVALLKDARRHKAARKKNYPDKRVSQSTDKADESLLPLEYSFGAGLAMASVLQASSARPPGMAGEEVFTGDGEVSQDSGNDEDA